MGTFQPVRCTLKPSPHSVSDCLVRSAKDHDAAALLGLLRELAHEPVFTVYEPDEMVRSLETERASIATYREELGRVMLVAEVGGELVGQLTFRAGKYRRIAHTGEMGMSVAAGWRGCGVGRAMLTCLIEWASVHPTVEKINLRVFANNERAIALYRSMGFVEEGRRKGEIRIHSGLCVDDLTMARFVRVERAASGE